MKSSYGAIFGVLASLSFASLQASSAFAEENCQSYTFTAPADPSDPDSLPSQESYLICANPEQDPNSGVTARTATTEGTFSGSGRPYTTSQSEYTITDHAGYQSGDVLLSGDVTVTYSVGDDDTRTATLYSATNTLFRDGVWVGTEHYDDPRGQFNTDPFGNVLYCAWSPSDPSGC